MAHDNNAAHAAAEDAVRRNENELEKEKIEDL